MEHVVSSNSNVLDFSRASMRLERRRISWTFIMSNYLIVAISVTNGGVEITYEVIRAKHEA